MKLAIDARKAYDGGIGRYVRCLSAALLEADPTLSIAFLMPERMPAFVDPHEGRVTRVDYDAGLYSFDELLGASARVTEAGVDLFHEPHYVLPFRIPVPRVVTIHDTIHVKFPRYLGGPVQRGYATFMVRSAARRAEHVLTVSESARRDVAAHARIDADRITATPLGVTPDFFETTDEDGATARSRLGVDGPFVLYVGALKPHKNPIGLCEAFEAASIAGPATLVLAGAGPLDVVTWGQSRGMGGRIRVVEVDDTTLRGLYHEARLFVLPSLYEGFGLPLLEAMASGTPAVASRVASTPEVGGEVPLYVPPGDVPALRAAIEALWADAPRREAMARAGRARAHAFTWRRTAELTLEVYRRAISAR